MKEKIFLSCFLFFCLQSTCFAESQVNVSDLVDKLPVDNVVKIDSYDANIKSRPSLVDRVAKTHNLQKELDTRHQEKIIEYSVNTRKTITYPDGRVEVIETSPSNVTLEAISQDKDKYGVLKDSTNSLGFAVLLFKALGGL